MKACLAALALYLMLFGCTASPPPAPQDCSEALGGDEDLDGGIGGTGHTGCPRAE